MIANDNSQCLEQAAELLRNCETKFYTRKVAECFDSSIGGHIRHILDHYQCFFQGLAAGEIDYDGRARDIRLEEDPIFAIEAINRSRTVLASLKIGPASLVRVKMDTGGDHDQLWAASTVQRELQFLLSHTVHHYALIATMYSISGQKTAADFGIAPSTLRYRRGMVK